MSWARATACRTSAMAAPASTTRLSGRRTMSASRTGYLSRTMILRTGPIRTSPLESKYSPLPVQGDTRVDPGLGDIDQQVSRHDEDRTDQDGAHDQVDVVGADGVEGQLAHPWPGKDALHNYNPAKKV